MLSIRKTLATASISALALSVFPARALQVTAPLQNGTAQTLNTTSPTNLQFAAFNAGNFPLAFQGLLPNQTLKLSSVKIQTQGTAGGDFTVINNSTTTTVPVSSGAFSYNILSNNVPSVLQTPSNQAGLTNTTGSVPLATAGSLNILPPTCTPPATLQTVVFGGTTFYYCQSPGTSTFTLNQPATSSTSFNWFIADATGNTNGVSSAYWTTGSSIQLPTIISFTPDSTKYPGGTLNPPNPAFTFALSPTNANTFLTYDYELITNTGVPAPLPIFGAGIGFGFSRRLRRRIKSAATLAS
jgi:hypothetical protein